MNPLNQAIANVQTTAAALEAADSAQFQANARFAEATEAKRIADENDQDAIAIFNAFLQELIAAAAGARIDRTPQLAPASSGSVATIPTV